MKNPKGIISVHIALSLLVIAIVAAGATYFFTRTDKDSKEVKTNIILNTNNTTGITNTNVPNTNAVILQNTNNNANKNTKDNVNTSNTSKNSYTGSIEGIRFSFTYPDKLGVVYKTDTDSTYIFSDKNHIDLAKDEVLYDIWLRTEKEINDDNDTVVNSLETLTCNADGPRGSTECLPVSDTQVSKLTTVNGLAYGMFQPTLKDTSVIFDANDEPVDTSVTTRLLGPAAYFFDSSTKKYIFLTPNSEREFTQEEINTAKEIFYSFQILH